MSERSGGSYFSYVLAPVNRRLRVHAKNLETLRGRIHTSGVYHQSHQNDRVAVQLFLKSGMDPNITTAQGIPALLIATMNCDGKLREDKKTHADIAKYSLTLRDKGEKGVNWPV